MSSKFWALAGALFICNCGGGGGSSSGSSVAPQIVFTGPPSTPEPTLRPATPGPVGTQTPQPAASNNVIPTPTPGPTATPLLQQWSASTGPLPYTPSSMPYIYTVASSSNRSPLATVIHTDLGLYANLASATTSYGVYANQSVYIQGLGMTNNLEEIFAPTIKGPGQDCLEISIAYWLDTQPETAIEIWDFCCPPGNPCTAGVPIIAMNIPLSGPNASTSAITNYIRVYPDGTPRVTVESYMGPDGYWHAIIFNYSTSSYVQLYTTSADPTQNGTLLPQNGWDSFEVYLVSLACPTLPGTISSMTPRILTRTGWVSNEWLSYGQFVYNAGVGPLNCSPLTYSPTFNQDSSWSVSSTGG